MGEVSIVISMNVTSSDKTSWPKKWKSEIQIITEYQSAEQFSLWSALSHLENGWSSKTCKTCSPKFINLILTLFGNVREHSCSLLCRRWIDWPSFCSPATATLTRKGTRRLWWNNISRMKRLPIFQPMSGILLFKVAYRIVRWFIPGSAILISTYYVNIKIAEPGINHLTIRYATLKSRIR